MALMNKGLLVVVSAPSGCGKDTVLKEVFKVAPEIKFSISCTSRPKRCEEDLLKYEMMSREQFEKLIQIGDLLGRRFRHGKHVVLRVFVKVLLPHDRDHTDGDKRRHGGNIRYFMRFVFVL